MNSNTGTSLIMDDTCDGIALVYSGHSNFFDGGFYKNIFRPWVTFSI